MPRHRRLWIACGTGAAAALGGALALVGFRIFATIHRTLELFYGDRGDPIPVPDLAAALLALAGAGLTIGAVALAIAGHRAARALERASLIEANA